MIDKMTRVYIALQNRFENAVTEADYDQVYIDWWETEFRCTMFDNILSYIAAGKTFDEACDIVLNDEQLIEESLRDAHALAEFA